jgi:hypothetical protein
MINLILQYVVAMLLVCCFYMTAVTTFLLFWTFVWPGQ